MNTKHLLISVIKAQQKADQENSHLKDSERIRIQKEKERKEEIEQLFQPAIAMLSKMMHCVVFRKFIDHIFDEKSSSFREFSEKTLEQTATCSCFHIRKKKHGDLIITRGTLFNIFISLPLAYARDAKKIFGLHLIRQGCANDGLTRYFLAVDEKVSELRGGTPVYIHRDSFYGETIDKELLLLAHPESAIKRICRIAPYSTFNPNC